jgi:ubiquinone/menaquinone biosynthesis C-methylase UbiE
MQRPQAIDPEIAKRRDKVRERVQNVVVRLVSHMHARRILDVGTGFGYNVRLLAQLFKGKKEVWSIDPSFEVLREARRMLNANGLTKNVKLLNAKVEDMPFQDGFFDMISSVMLVHHLVDFRNGLREMVRVLADNGRLFIVDWRPVSSKVIPHRARDFADPEEILQILVQLGLSVRLRKYRYWYFIEGKK